MSARHLGIFIFNRELRLRVREAFARAGWTVRDFENEHELDDAVRWMSAAVVECANHNGDTGLRLARAIRAKSRTAGILILAAQSSEELAIEAVRLGAVDYMKAPFDMGRLERLARESVPAPRLTNDAMVGANPAMVAVKKFIERVSASDTNVLILGETGTGKEMVAERIHKTGARGSKPFVCVNCSAIPDGLIESELFGSEKGAFTGASSLKDGKLVQAHGGTIFFDEIGDMSLLAQAKVLRAIESKQVFRLGGSRPVHVDVRIMAATNRNLEAMMREDKFRSDLYFRLHVARIELPPLRERRSDIPLLIEHFLRHYNRTFGAAVECFEGVALRDMMEYSWPGNVRELKNVMEIVFLHLDRRQSRVRKLPDQVLDTWRKLQNLPADDRERLLSVLLSTEWNISEAARQMRWSRMTMYRKLAKYRIKPERATEQKRASARITGS